MYRWAWNSDLWRLPPRFAADGRTHGRRHPPPADERRRPVPESAFRRLRRRSLVIENKTHSPHSAKIYEPHYKLRTINVLFGCRRVKSAKHCGGYYPTDLWALDEIDMQAFLLVGALWPELISCVPLSAPSHRNCNDWWCFWVELVTEGLIPWTLVELRNPWRSPSSEKCSEWCHSFVHLV